jgi:hypothetical protein
MLRLAHTFCRERRTTKNGSSKPNIRLGGHEKSDLTARSSYLTIKGKHRRM